MPTALPPNPFVPGPLYDAYSQCVALQAKADVSRVEDIGGCPPPIICARLLGHLLYLAPVEGLRKEIAETKSDDEKLMRLATFYFRHFVSLFMHARGASSKSLSGHDDEDMETVMNRFTDCHIADARVMKRDDHRCMITGLHDRSQPGCLVPVRIIPPVLKTNQYSDFAAAWSILSTLTSNNVTHHSAKTAIDDPENTLSLNRTSARYFEELLLWLKPVEGVDHTYLVCIAFDGMRRYISLSETVTFSTQTDIPLPLREYLGLHALCCEVAWMSGAADYLRDIERIVEMLELKNALEIRMSQ